MTLTLDQQQRMDFLWCLFDNLMDTKDLHGDSGEALLELTARVYGSVKETSWEQTLQDMDFECGMIEQLWKETPDVTTTSVGTGIKGNLGDNTIPSFPSIHTDKRTEEKLTKGLEETPNVEVTGMEDPVEPVPDRGTAVPIAKEIQEGLIVYSCPLCSYAMFRDATRVVAHIKVAH